MASNSTTPLLLNNGLDLVTPPLLSEPGALLDCLNYEMTSEIGYKKIDGYEPRDGWPTGGIARFYQIEVTEAFPGSLVGYDIGQLIVSDYNTPLEKHQGVIVDIFPISGGRRIIRYVPADSNLKLQIGDKIGTTNDTIFVGSTDGRSIVTDPTTYLTTIRNYSATLRSLVQPAATQIAGTTYSRDRHYEVQNTSYIRIFDVSGVVPRAGDVVRFRGKRWKFVGARFPTDAGANYKGEWHFIDLNIPASPNNNDIVSLSSPSGGTYATAQSGTITTTDSYYGYLTYLYNEKFLSRGRRIMSPALTFDFINGTTPGDSSGPEITGLGAGNYFVTDAGGFTLVKEVHMSQVVLESGSWTTANAAGRMQLVWNITQFGNREFLIAGDEIHTAYPTSASTRVATIGTVTSASMYSTLLAGTGALRQHNTRYQWGTYNFYGDPKFRQLFGTNGVTRAFWADTQLLPGETGTAGMGVGAYGSITTQDDDTLDNPKYLAFHAGVNLALGFAAGSVQLSVGGVPYDYNGAHGALETATGDDITGLLESSNDTTLVFGRRSIRRITGTDDNTMALETVVANSGALDYTAVNVGSVPVFCGPHGVQTLQQAQEYGDFVGGTATAPIYPWLKPKLVPDQGVIERAGVACALPVRAKQQYRLFLNTGDVVSVAFTTEGPKCMISNYQGYQQTPRIPFAFSSEMGDNNREYVQVVWDEYLGPEVGEPGQFAPPGNQAYQLDNGWGFAGAVFNHYFDVSYTFLNNGSVAGVISKVRMYGLGYGVATLDLKASGIEEDFDLPFSSRIQPINMPTHTKLLYDRLQPVTGIVDHQNWGFGTKLRINGTITVPGGNTTEPSHISQVLVLHLDEPGATDA